VVFSCHLFFSCFFLLVASTSASAQARKTDIYFFYGQGCPHCAEEEILLKKIEAERKDVAIHRYEIWNNGKNAEFFKTLNSALGWNARGVPMTAIGEKVISGYLNEETTGQEILSAVNQCAVNGCVDVVGEYIKNGITQNKAKAPLSELKNITLPIFGQINVKDFSLPILTFIIAVVDGFNPCALWVLLFLISLSITSNNRGRLLVLGSAFILTSAIFYFLVLSAWLNMIFFIGFIFWLRVAIGAVAIYAGYYNIKKYIDRKKSCEVIEVGRRKKIIDRIKELTMEKKIWPALMGIIILAVSINAFELVCSAGLPAVYVQILSLSALASWEYYAYLVFYAFVFVLNQIIILAIALTTFKMKAINPKFILAINLIGGIIMLIIGLLLLFKPSWLMFG